MDAGNGGAIGGSVVHGDRVGDHAGAQDIDGGENAGLVDGVSWAGEFQAGVIIQDGDGGDARIKHAGARRGIGQADEESCVTFDLVFLEDGDQDSLGGFAIAEDKVTAGSGVFYAGSCSAIGSEKNDAIGTDSIGAQDGEENIGSGFGHGINGIGERETDIVVK